MSNILKVSVVKEGSQGEKIGIRVGDVISSYNGTPVHSNIEFSNAIHKAKESETNSTRIGIRREEQDLVFEVTTDPLGIDCIETSEIMPKSAELKSDYQEIVIKDIQMSFVSMVVFMIKWVLASIPAFIILAVLFAIISAIFGSLIFGGRF